jgi:segregation and condensation protein A
LEQDATILEGPSLVPPERLSADLADDQVFVVATDGYEGPLDLLLSLARDQKVDLRQISILQLVDQYIAFVASNRDLRLDLAADYLVMAAWLALLKSRLLVPEAVKPEEKRSAEDDAKELADGIRRLAKLREAVAFLDGRNRLGRDWLPPGSLSDSGPKKIGSRSSATLLDMLTAFVREAKRNAPPRIPALEPFDLSSVEDAIGRLSSKVGRLDGWNRLRDLLPTGGGSLRRRSEMATHFVAMLELARTGRLTFRQEDLFGPIWIRKAEEGLDG